MWKKQCEGEGCDKGGICSRGGAVKAEGRGVNLDPQAPGCMSVAICSQHPSAGLCCGLGPPVGWEVGVGCVGQ